MHLITNNSLTRIYVNEIYTLVAISRPSAKGPKRDRQIRATSNINRIFRFQALLITNSTG